MSDAGTRKDAKPEKPKKGEGGDAKKAGAEDIRLMLPLLASLPVRGSQCPRTRRIYLAYPDLALAGRPASASVYSILRQ